MVVSLTIACLGVVICISFFLWVCCCKVTNCIASNILDGSQALTLLLLVGIALMFCSVFPYVATHASPVVCAIRANCVPLVYVFVFSTILSRSGTISNQIHCNSPISIFRRNDTFNFRIFVFSFC